jgi:hypothetical protein
MPTSSISPFRCDPSSKYGLARQGERGVFFYFTAPDGAGGGRRHFWRYYDIAHSKLLDNRFLITNLIACSPDTPRVTGDCDIFAIQEKVIEDILQSVQEQQAVEAAPKILDPIQQNVITLLRGYLNSPAIPRKDVRTAMQKLSRPMPNVAIRGVRSAYEAFSRDQDIHSLVKAINDTEGGHETREATCSKATHLKRENLHLLSLEQRTKHSLLPGYKHIGRQAC